MTERRFKSADRVTVSVRTSTYFSLAVRKQKLEVMLDTRLTMSDAIQMALDDQLERMAERKAKESIINAADGTGSA